MGAGGRLNPRDLDIKKNDTNVIKRAPTSKPPFTLADLKKSIPPHCFERSMIRSFSYLVADLTAVSVFYYVATTYIPQLPHPLPYLAWPIYWFLQGCVFMGIWLIAHECGHHAFSDYVWLEDTIGFILHSFLLTPYFSWKISHRRHHANTGSLEHDEVYVPKTRFKLASSAFYLDNPIGRTLTLIVKLTLGWYIYLSINAAGRPYDKFASHYDPRSPIFSDNERVLILMSDIGLVSFSYLLYKVAMVQGFTWVFCAYGGALMVMNAFVVTITYLHHTHPSLPHYDDSEWNWMKGAFSTIDRDYGVLNKVFHNITDTHVLHHLFSYIPHYHAMEATKAIRPIVGEFYQSDSTPFFVALWRESKNCLFIEPDECDEKNKGIYWYKSQE
ncbi:omega-6 fatty acid desaturase [Artemisia annua]|uniref:Omega-6 fatty acid desaturase n=1 Tax=Artemisia annua TaxID=35608 RepID=A0A2U1NWN2_ARTAN|nr:omega-6 fatty acid desaturase [Artemisia annua]